MKLQLLKEGDYKATIIRTRGYIILFSYCIPIAAIDSYNGGYDRLCDIKDLTHTTSKHLKQFLEMFGLKYDRKAFLETTSYDISVLIGE